MNKLMVVASAATLAGTLCAASPSFAEGEAVAPARAVPAAVVAKPAAAGVVIVNPGDEASKVGSSPHRGDNASKVGSSPHVPSGSTPQSLTGFWTPQRPALGANAKEPAKVLHKPFVREPLLPKVQPTK